MAKAIENENQDLEVVWLVGIKQNIEISMLMFNAGFQCQKKSYSQKFRAKTSSKS